MWLSPLLRLLFPRSCPGCGQELLRQEGEVCWGCLGGMEPTGYEATAAENPLLYRFAGKVRIDHAAGLYHFEKKGTLQKVVQQLKYHKQPRIGDFLGEYFGKMLAGQAWMQQYQALVPVPLHPRRLAERGYNQSERIAGGISRATGIPCFPHALRRQQATASQTRKDKDARWENVKDVFALAQLPPGGILLVDDVVTTGSTLEACLHVLQGAPVPPPAQGILCLGVARHG